MVTSQAFTNKILEFSPAGKGASLSTLSFDGGTSSSQAETLAAACPRRMEQQVEIDFLFSVVTKLQQPARPQLMFPHI